MDKVSIVFTFTNDFIVPAYIAVKSLMDSARVSTKYEIIVIHYDLSKHSVVLLKNLVFPTRHEIKFKRFNKEIIADYPNTEHWPGIVYIRLFLPEILVKYDKVIYSDVDVLFRGDLSDVYQIEMDDCEWAGIRAEKNTGNMIGHKYFANNRNEYIYMSGFMVCNLKQMRAKGFTDIVRKNIQQYSSELLMFDLDILNMSTEDIKDIPIRYAFLVDLYENKDIRDANQYAYMKKVYTYKELLEEKKNTVIIHYAGRRGKPWIDLFPGDEYVQYIRSLPKGLKKIYRKNRFKALVSRYILGGKK